MPAYLDDLPPVRLHRAQGRRAGLLRLADRFSSCSIRNCPKSRVAARLAAVTDVVVTQTVHGLTTGALSPATLGARGTIEDASPADEKRTQ